MRSLPWPEMESQQAAGHTIRALLDYLCWMSREMRQIGFHAGSEREEWCRRVQTAYSALFIPMIPGHGDPYPPDVPPARNPGIWPDIPSARIPGMTLRHQLTVMEMLARNLRELRWAHARAAEIAEWDRRIVTAYHALDHGESMTIPEEARSDPSEAALEEAAAAQRALQERARRRSEQLRKHMQKMQAEERARKKAAKQKAAAKKKKKKKTAAKKKKAAAKKKKATAKKRKAAARKKKAAARKKKAAPRKKKAAAKRK